jgi:CBS domain-containing protein
MYEVNLSKTVGDVVQGDFVSIDENATVAEAAKIMRDKDTTCALVTTAGSKEPIGIVTERDILYRVVAENKGPFKVALKEIMSSPLISVSEKELVKDAILSMRKKHIRRLAVKDTAQKIIGTITLMSIGGNTPSESIDLADIELPSNVIEMKEAKIICPYCQSRFESKMEMSKHIDRIHIGSGLLEGDMRQW